MTQTRVTTVDGSAAVLLPLEIIEQMGVQIGDEIDVAVTGDTLVMRRVSDEPQQERTLDEIVDDLFERRADAYRRLAEGVD